MAKLLMIANDETTIYNFRREILRAFSAAGHDVILAMPKGEHTKEIEACGCSIVDIAVSRHGTNPLQDFRLLQTFRRLIRQYRPDVVLTYTVKPNVYGSLACQMEKVPYLNNVTGLGSVLQKDSALAKLILSLQKLAFRKSSCVFFQNESNYRELLNRGVISSETPHEILPGSGVNLELNAYVPMREDDGTVRFIIVSRLRDDKGYREFFEAAERVKEKRPNTEFHVVGWIEEEKYKAVVDNLVQRGIIIFHGKQVQENVHKLIAESDCLVHPSYHEGMSNVLLEAAATGRPVIASDIPGCRETFDEGITGVGCKDGDAKSLIWAIEQIVSIPWASLVEMGKMGRRKIEKAFDRKIVAQRYLLHINSILKNIEEDRTIIGR